MHKPRPQEPPAAPPRQPWLLSCRLPLAALRAAAGDDLSWLSEVEVATAWLWGFRLLT